MITKQEVDVLWKDYQAARKELNESELTRREHELFRRYRQARDELDVQVKLEHVQAKADRKAAFAAEFKAATDKRPLRELVADELVVGPLEDWQFATKAGIKIALPTISWRPNAGKFTFQGSTWEALRIRIATSGYGSKRLEGLRFLRVSDSSKRAFAADNVVAWRLVDMKEEE